MLQSFTFSTIIWNLQSKVVTKKISVLPKFRQRLLHCTTFLKTVAKVGKYICSSKYSIKFNNTETIHQCIQSTTQTSQCKYLNRCTKIPNLRKHVWPSCQRVIEMLQQQVCYVASSSPECYQQPSCYFFTMFFSSLSFSQCSRNLQRIDAMHKFMNTICITIF